MTTGTTTTATVTINVAASTPASFNQLRVHGTASGLAEATADYGLIVIAPPGVSTL